MEGESHPQMPKHVSIVYKELIDGLRETKKQQWTTTNYAILLLAAVFAVSSRGLDLSHGSSILKFGIGATAILATCLLIKLQRDIAAGRARLDTMEKIYFKDADLESTGLSRGEIDRIKKQTLPRRIGHFLRGWESLATLIVVLWGACLLVFWAL